MLDTTYCHHIGAQYMFIREPEIQFWLRKKMEEPRNTPFLLPRPKEADPLQAQRGGGL
jgi:2-oxoglutarate dehydrogenase complex dehydrogenase (E1) component-like enzyme